MKRKSSRVKDRTMSPRRTPRRATKRNLISIIDKQLSKIPWYILDPPTDTKPKPTVMTQKKIPNALFDVDEKVLCYEPDPTKAKVLYDSKVLEVVERKEKGKKSIEYRVHFQGWNSSWDRFVGEKYILKRDDENLALQDELRDKAKVLNESLKIKKKKQSYTLTDLIRASLDKSSNGNEDASAGGSTSGDSFEDASDDEGSKESVPIVVPESIKRRLEDDYYLINEDQQLVQVPAKLNIVKILEDYVKHYGLTALAGWIETMRSRTFIPTPPTTSPIPLIASTSAASSSQPHLPNTKGVAGAPLLLTEEKIEPDELLPVIQRVQLVKEVVEGVRILFDFLINQILLYSAEIEQFKSVIHLKPPESVSKIKVSDYIAKDYITKSDCEQDQSSDPGSDEPSAKKKRSGSKTPKRTCTFINPDLCTDLLPYTGPRLEGSTSAICYKPQVKTYLQLYKPRIDHYIKILMNWKLMRKNPDEGEPVEEEEPSPSYMYGSIHLLRLFVRLPNILSQANMPKKRLSIVVQLLNQFIQYLSRQDTDHSIYAPAKQFSEEVSSDEEEEEEEEEEEVAPKKVWKARSYCK